MNIRIFTVLMAILVPLCMSAQRFLEPAYSFSKKKLTYITMEDGSELQVNLKKIKLEKGLIEEIKVESLNDEKIKIKPDDIKHMYLPPSGLDKLGKTVNFMTDATLWDQDELDGDLFGQGYVYFEKSKVRIKKKTETMMLQLLNPHFSNKIRVYHDPFAKETAGIGVAGIKMTGGLDKSYYVKKDDVAVRLKKKDYDEEFPMYFKDCGKLRSKYKDNLKWADFVTHIHTYATSCD